MDLILGALPQCCVVGCPEMASPRGGHQIITVTLSAADQSMATQAHIFTCVQHAEEFADITAAGARIGG